MVISTSRDAKHFRKWARRERGLYRVDNERTSTTDFFFLDELEEKRLYISVSVGDVWLYFWQEILIGVRDLRVNEAAFLKVDDDNRPEEDGYSHRHEITDAIVDGAMHEVYPDKHPPKRLSPAELQALAFRWVADSCVKHVERELKG